MSRAALKSRSDERKHQQRLEREDARLIATMRRLEAKAAADACLAACERCGLVQVADNPAFDDLLFPCILCGCQIGLFVEALPGHNIGS